MGYGYTDRGTESAKRAQAFAHLDEARLGWFHLRAVIVSGVGFFADAYDIFVIGQAIPMVYQIYYGPQYISGSYPANIPGLNNTQPIPKTPQNTKVNFNDNYPMGAHMDAWLKASTNWGNFFGQIGFGILGDQLGRKKMYGVELIVMIVCTIGSAMAGPMVHGFNILVILSIWRFFLGVGIGGDYPMSAVITSEFANVRYRGMMLSAVFAMQGIGIMVGGLVYMATLAAFKSQIQTDYTTLDIVWRIALGFGAVPALGAVYFRMTIPETPRFTVDVIGDTHKADSDVARVLALNNVASVSSSWEGEDIATAKVAVKSNTFADFRAYFGQWRHMKTLIGTSYTWFALDVAWYGLALNQSTVLSLINFNGPAKVKVNGASITPPVDIAELFYQNALGNLIIAFCGTVPGYWFCVAFVEKLGRKPIQYCGFLVITICLTVLAVMWDTIKTQQIPFLVVFTIAQFFFQFGPNTTTFVIPGEVFPTRFRSTGHGISAGCGKLGAIIGIQVVGPYFIPNAQIVLATFAVIMATGGIATALVPETAGKTLEELSGEEDVILS
ncbi:phosphate transporter [Chytriomyces hyalinus]|nr:phosphate transporter [Chytriomyces hyalinus]KAJ3252689.1 phosphate transporter [Chytriomyces hyalinus]